MKTNHKIIVGDSRDMSNIANNSVHLVVTSPPYWQLKDYGSKNQIGFNDSYEQYINNLNLVWSECFRVLHNGCRLCINIGDQFARSVYYGRYKVIPIRTEIIKFCESIGFDYMGAIIWQKSTTMNTSGGATIMGSFPYPRNGIIKLDYEFILIFKKLGKPPIVSKEVKEKSKLSKEEWNQYFHGHWNFNGAKQIEHLAMFPEELPKRLIKMFSFVGDTILDPFLGSGTTILAAKNNDRNSCGFEINKQFLDVIKDKIGYGKEELFDVCTFDFIEQRPNKTNFEKRINNFSYVFRDLVKVDRKIDPKKMTFGSKIDQENNVKNKNIFVKEYISVSKIMLSNNIIISLIGIKENPKTKNKALQYLENKLKNQPLVLGFDVIKYDNDNNLLCYLYLKNKTFINAHLIKNKLADVDCSIDYKYKNKFIKLLNR